jgi:hypothetical protein
MNKVNGGRAIVGGLIAGLVIFFTMGIVNGIFLNQDWKVWQALTAEVAHPPPPPVSMTLWFLMSLVNGQALIWIYAGIRNRYGPGPATALRAAFLFWLAAFPIVWKQFCKSSIWCSTKATPPPGTIWAVLPC